MKGADVKRIPDIFRLRSKANTRDNLHLWRIMPQTYAKYRTGESPNVTASPFFCYYETCIYADGMGIFCKKTRLLP